MGGSSSSSNDYYEEEERRQRERHEREERERREYYNYRAASDQLEKDHELEMNRINKNLKCQLKNQEKEYIYKKKQEEDDRYRKNRAELQRHENAMKEINNKIELEKIRIENERKNICEDASNETQRILNKSIRDKIEQHNKYLKELEEEGYKLDQEMRILEKNYLIQRNSIIAEREKMEKEFELNMKELKNESDEIKKEYDSIQQKMDQEHKTKTTEEENKFNLEIKKLKDEQNINLKKQSLKFNSLENKEKEIGCQLDEKLLEIQKTNECLLKQNDLEKVSKVNELVVETQEKIENNKKEMELLKIKNEETKLKDDYDNQMKILEFKKSSEYAAKKETFETDMKMLDMEEELRKLNSQQFSNNFMLNQQFGMPMMFNTPMMMDYGKDKGNIYGMNMNMNNMNLNMNMNYNMTPNINMNYNMAP